MCLGFVMPKVRSLTQKKATLALAKQRANSSGRFRTTPIPNTIKHITSLPKSAVIFKCAASQFWQFRVHLQGRYLKRSTQQTDETKAKRKAALLYAAMLQNMHDDDIGTRRVSHKDTLQICANSLFEKQTQLIANGELSKHKVKTETYVFNSHIKPFFSQYKLKDIDAEALEAFKMHLAQKGLAKATQKNYVDIISKILQEAVKKHYINSVPQMPRIRQDDNPRGYFDTDEYRQLWQAANKHLNKPYHFVSASGKPYRKITITAECKELILFMRNTFIRPTDIKQLKHGDIYVVQKDDMKLLELRHGTTKRHKNYMASTPHAHRHYTLITERRKAAGFGADTDYVFMPHILNRDYALKELARQFTAILHITGLKTDKHGKERTLYSLRHTAIVTALRLGIPNQLIASNARTSTAMIDRFYGTHINSALEMGKHIFETYDAVERFHAERKAKLKAAAAHAEKP